MLSVGLVEVRPGAAMHAIETPVPQVQEELQASS
jgi:hypothetical protein